VTELCVLVICREENEYWLFEHVDVLLVFVVVCKISSDSHMHLSLRDFCMLRAMSALL